MTDDQKNVRGIHPNSVVFTELPDDENTKAAAANDLQINNPTYEFYPEVEQKPFNFLSTLHVLPACSNTIFIFARTKLTLFDYSTGTVNKKFIRYPRVPKIIPLTGSSLWEVGSRDWFGVPEWYMEDFLWVSEGTPDAVILADGTVLFIKGTVCGCEKSSKWTVFIPSEISRVYHSVATLVADGLV
ncbi:13827_t:CDS:2 [Ambispora leptoticha]|uniref:13827_t:CDS:1 n=1 Tax=Ambispora leptoticha TaxID=144679 RepID=A0A9N9D5E6_9GLOM|nr:13827_t:CDS:2 [Ambispora leptoticha]